MSNLDIKLLRLARIQSDEVDGTLSCTVSGDVNKIGIHESSDIHWFAKPGTHRNHQKGPPAHACENP